MKLTHVPLGRTRFIFRRLYDQLVCRDQWFIGRASRTMPTSKMALDLPDVWFSPGKLVLAALVFWGCFVSVAIVYATINFGFDHRAHHTPADILIVVVGSLFSVIMYLALRHLVALPLHLSALIAASLVVVLAVLANLTFKLLLQTVVSNEPAVLGTASNLTTATLWIAPLGCWAAGSLAVLSNAVAQATERRLAAVKAEAQDAQVRALQQKMNPHFFFNALNTLSSLILDRRNDVAETLVLRLSSFFRASFTTNPADDHCLSEEIGLQRRYLDIEKLRFADALEISVDLPKKLRSARVPCLILQPVVENTIRSGLSTSGDVTKLSIRARGFSGMLQLEVCDNGCGWDVEGQRDVPDVRQRLSARYGKAAKVEIDRLEAGGCLVRLTMPLIFA